MYVGASLFEEKRRASHEDIVAHLLLRMVSGTMSLTAAGPRTSPAAAKGLGRWPGFFT